MDRIKSTISAFRKVLETHEFMGPQEFPEDFAVKRFLKKFQRPNTSHQEDLASQCWERWIKNDEELPRILLPNPLWYKVRLQLRQLRSCNFREFAFPQGSEFFGTRGRNSLQSRLARSEWSVTRDAFEAFASIVYNHKALKRAFRRRFSGWFRKVFPNVRAKLFDAYLYRKFSKLGDGVPYRIFLWKFERIVTFVEGSRFATVPKNNDTRRPINIEPFGNMLVQRSIGIHLRNEIKRIFGIDLDTLQELHRTRVADTAVATLDLKDASDSISLELVRFCVPNHVFSQIDMARSPLTLGLDGNYHLTKKVSAMGNGYTFELMSLLLNAVCKQVDSGASVFGDDIIVRKDVAQEVIEALVGVGLKVNLDKSFLDGPFRESCGANYHDSHGYIESYDFEWPETIHDCAVLLNKVRMLSHHGTFAQLANRLQRCMPSAYCSGLEPRKPPRFDPTAPAPELDTYFRTRRVSKKSDFVMSKKVYDAVRDVATRLHYKEPPIFWIGFSYKPKLASKTVRHLFLPNHWAKYEMYLHGGRVTDDVITGQGTVSEVLFVRFGDAVFRLRDILRLK